MSRPPGIPEPPALYLQGGTPFSAAIPEAIRRTIYETLDETIHETRSILLPILPQSPGPGYAGFGFGADPASGYAVSGS